MAVCLWLVTLVTDAQPRARAIDQQRGVRTYWVLGASGVYSGFFTFVDIRKVV